MLVSNIKSDFTFKNFVKETWNDEFRKYRVLPDKLVAMVTPDNLGTKHNYFGAA